MTGMLEEVQAREAQRNATHAGASSRSTDVDLTGPTPDFDKLGLQVERI